MTLRSVLQWVVMAWALGWSVMAQAAEFKLMQVVGKSPAAVAHLLGKPFTSEPSKYGRRVTYPGGVEIVFIKGKADWITIQPDGVRFERAAVQKIGLPIRTPDFANSTVIRWNDYPGIMEVNMFPGGGGMVDYFYVKVRTR